jgi:hypothetical protein
MRCAAILGDQSEEAGTNKSRCSSSEHTERNDNVLHRAVKQKCTGYRLVMYKHGMFYVSVLLLVPAITNEGIIGQNCLNTPGIGAEEKARVVPVSSQGGSRSINLG